MDSAKQAPPPLPPHRQRSSPSPFSSAISLDKLFQPALASLSTSPPQLQLQQQSYPGLPQRSPSSSSLHKSFLHGHRSSFAENLRTQHTPSSPRASRHSSFTQAAIQELIAHPPPSRQPNPRFAGRDWRDVQLGELLQLSTAEVRWVDMESSVEDATMVLVKGNVAGNCVLLKDGPLKKPVSTFDYGDLNAYLLAVVGLAKPDEEQVALYDSIARRAQEREAIPLRDIQPICRHEQLVLLPPEVSLPGAIEVFGSGIHRLLVTTQDGETLGVVSQLKVLEFFWSEGINFPAIDRLYPAFLRDLHVGSRQIIAINADAPLAEALVLMSNEGLTSVAVVDDGSNVVGNISTADVRLLTSAASVPLLQSSCMHFITIVLTERGMEKGRDSAPVFYVNPYSTLAHTVAKLVATRSHRMWVVESASPSPSDPATPLLGPKASAGSASRSLAATATVVTAGATTAGAHNSQASTPPCPHPSSTLIFPTPSNAVPAAAMAGAHLSGKLIGVISLTDVLNLFARSSGLQPADPGEQRARRRRSSSSSMHPSLDGGNVRGSLEYRR